MDQLQIQSLLEELAGDTFHVYFQPPATVTMVYPCIVYKRDFAKSLFADNVPYRHRKRYAVTVIDRDPNSAVPDKIAFLPMCLFERSFVAGNLNHDVFNVYF